MTTETAHKLRTLKTDVPCTYQHNRITWTPKNVVTTDNDKKQYNKSTRHEQRVLQSTTAKTVLRLTTACSLNTRYQCYYY